MASQLRVASKRKTIRRNYAEFNSLEKTEMDEADLLELQANEDGEFESLEDEKDRDLSITSDWETRKVAVNDENYRREQDMYQQQMRLLNEKELVIERERKLIEMKEGLALRQKRLQEMEKELASRSAELERYEEHVFNPNTEGKDWRKEREKDVDSWVQKAEKTTLKNPIHGHANRKVKFTGADKVTHEYTDELGANTQPHYNRDQLFEDAMALIHDNDLTTCRQTGTSRLKTMGLMPEQLQCKGRRSEPLIDLGDRLEPKASMQKHRSSSRINPGTSMTAPIIGTLDDGESICSHDSKISMDINNSDRSETEKRKLKSGMYAKIADDVVRQLKWPHKKLAARWVPARLQMNQLSFEQVVAGELGIIQRSNDPEEVRGRIHILQKIAYWNMQNEGWNRVREVYMSILHAIEEGDANFRSQFDEYDSMFPVKRHTTNTKKAVSKRDTFWCRAYNKGQCGEDTPHKAMVAGTERTVHHICANCWKLGRKEKHPDTDQRV